MMDDENNVVDAIDSIGETIFSKQWLIQRLIKLMKIVASEISNNVENADEDDVELCQDLGNHREIDEFIEQDLCILWDMSSNVDVQECLIEHKAEKLLSMAVLQTQKPRLAEICIGILANLCHNEQISNSILSEKEFCLNILSLLSSSDVPFLLQLIRFINTILHRNHRKFSEIIMETNENLGTEKRLFQDLQFLFENCLNIDLLRALFHLVNDLLYLSPQIAKSWRDNGGLFDWIKTFCDACNLIIDDLEDDNDLDEEHLESENHRYYHYFWFIVENLLDDCESIGVETETMRNIFPYIKKLFLKSLAIIHFETFNSLSSFSAACEVILKFKHQIDLRNELLDTDQTLIKIYGRFLRSREILQEKQSIDTATERSTQEIKINIEEFFNWWLEDRKEGKETSIIFPT
ncbi:ruvB-like 1 [Sarcoptes scabiei]|nr:ruvB-like 1 [Sarcoptes scabiei]